MTVNVPGYSSLTGNPAVILEVLKAASVAIPEVKAEGKSKAEIAENILREMARNKIINIQEETT